MALDGLLLISSSRRLRIRPVAITSPRDDIDAGQQEYQCGKYSDRRT